MTDAPLPASSSASVAIVGAGPVGLSLALGLARSGVRSVLLERNARTHQHSRAAGIHVRTREALRQWGVDPCAWAPDALLRTLRLHDARRPGRVLLEADFGVLEDEAEAPGLLVIPQSRTEAELLEAVRRTGMCELRFGTAVEEVEGRSDGVRLSCRAAGGESRVEAAYAVGCDGAGSLVRRSLDLPFVGRTYALRPVLADVRIDDRRDALPAPRVANERGALTFCIRLEPGLWRVVHLADDAPEGAGEAVSRAELAPRVEAVLGPGPFEVVWSSRFRIHRRAAPRFRVGRVLLAGDAAHVHSPAGGLGMNAGVLDAHNLAWKLARAQRGGDAERLLGSYEVERRAVVVEEISRYAERVTRGFLQGPAPLRAAAFALARAALRVPRLRRRGVRRTAMLDLDYPASPLLDAAAEGAGRRVPDPVLRAPRGGLLRLYERLPYRPALIDLSEGEASERRAGGVDSIRIGSGGYAEPAGLLRALAGGRPGWIAVRPDAHVAAVTRSREEADYALRRALGGGG